MSLKEACLSLAERMHKDIEDFCPGSEFKMVRMLVGGWANELKGLVQAAGPIHDELILPGQIHFPPTVVEDAIRVATEERKRIQVEEAFGQEMVELIGGPVDFQGTDMFPIDPRMPKGAKTLVGGLVYIRTERGLEFSETETQKFRDQPKG